MFKTTHFFIAAAGSLLISCGGNKESEHHEENKESVSQATPDNSSSTVNDTTKFKFDFAIANIPSPASGIEHLSELNVPYDHSILNDIKKVNTYGNEFSRSLNLGIYNMDMAYAMVNSNMQDIVSYMKDIVELSDKLGLKQAISDMVGKRAENNMENIDSLLSILDDIFVRSDAYLRTNERVFTASTVFVGSWLESLYLNCKLGEMAKDDKKASARTRLWEQRFHLGNLIGILNDYKDKKECTDLLADLKSIHSEIVSVKSQEEMTDEKFKGISSKIFSLRNKVTN